jgi:nucleoside-diphosphate-sugar epimerase
MKAIKVLITGSNGFIGGNLVDKLVGSKADVRCLIRHNSTGKHSDNAEIKNYAIDYSRIETLLDCAAFDGVEYIFHLAGITKGITTEVPP